MQPGSGEDGCKDHDNPPAAGHRVHDRDAPSPSSPLPSPEGSSEKKLEDEPVASLPEDALVEILSRVPYRSLRRFKCVSKAWLALCSATDIRRRSPLTLSGFFHSTMDGLKFHNLSGGGPPMFDPSLPFLRERYRLVTVEQCCSSLLLCQCYKSSSEGQEYDYVVCNPTTEKWVVLPPIVLPDGRPIEFYMANIFLGFDTATLSRFVVFAPLGGYGYEFLEVAMYSSETGRWTSVQSEWGWETILVGNPDCVFLDGIMHLTTCYSSVVTVDAEMKVWRKIRMPDTTSSNYGYTMASIGQSQGCLHAWRIDNHYDCQLYVWVLEDYDNGKWILRHTVNLLELFGRNRRRGTQSYCYKMFAIHPECDLIFLTDGEEMTVSYDMDNQKVHVISASKEFLDGLPYTPCFVE